MAWANKRIASFQTHMRKRYRLRIAYSGLAWLNSDLITIFHKLYIPDSYYSDSLAHYEVNIK